MNMQSLKNTQATQTCTHTIVVMAEALERRATHGSATGVKAAAAAGAAAHRTSMLALIPATQPLGGGRSSLAGLLCCAPFSFFNP